MLWKSLGFIFVRRDGLGDDVDLHPGERLGGIDKPFHLLRLLVLRERRRLEFASIHFRASSIPANAVPVPSAMATTLVEMSSFTCLEVVFIIFLRFRSSRLLSVFSLRLA